MVYKQPVASKLKDHRNINFYGSFAAQKFPQNDIETSFTLFTPHTLGLHDLQTVLLLLLLASLAPVLLFQLSCTLGIFHSSWILAHIFPISKSDKFDSIKYRPIAIISLISKTTENISIK